MHLSLHLRMPERRVTAETQTVLIHADLQAAVAAVEVLVLQANQRPSVHRRLSL